MSKGVVDLKQYEKTGEIGSGAYGNVFKIKKLSDGKLYAAKVLKFNVTDEGDQKKNFERELSCHQSLDNPAIIKFVGYSPLDFEGNDFPVLITKYMENGCLKSVLKSKPKEWNNTKMVINILGIALGMKYLHDSGIIHRDLKPPNVLLDSHFYPRLTDFGTSRHLEANEKDLTNLVGTPFYMAPEVSEGDTYSFEVDVFSFGMILYELYAQLPPTVPGKTNYQIIQNIIKGIRPNMKKIPDGNAKDLIKRCWDESPENRPTFDDIIHYYTTNKDEFWPDDVDEQEVDKYLNKFGFSLDPDKIVDFFIKHPHRDNNSNEEEEEENNEEDSDHETKTKKRKTKSKKSDDDDEDEEDSDRATKTKKRKTKSKKSDDDDEDEEDSDRATKTKKRKTKSKKSDDDEEDSDRATKTKKRKTKSKKSDDDDEDDEDSDRATKKKKDKKKDKKKRKEDTPISLTTSITELRSLLISTISENEYIPDDCKEPENDEDEVISTLDEKRSLYYQQALDDEDVKSLYYIANSYRKGQNGFPEDKGLAYKYMKKAALQGSSNAMYGLAYLMLPDFKNDDDEDRAKNFIDILKIAVEFGNELASYVFGFIYSIGFHVEKNYIMALVYTKYAADKKYPAAMLMYADRLRKIANEEIPKKELNQLIKDSTDILNDISGYSTRSNKLRITAKALFETIEEPSLADFVSRVYYQKVIDYPKSTDKQKRIAQNKLNKLEEQEIVEDYSDAMYSKLFRTIR